MSENGEIEIIQYLEKNRCGVCGRVVDGDREEWDGE